MKTLIVYYSFTRNNELLAMNIQSRLGCEIFKVETVRKRSTFSIFLDMLFGRKPAIRKHNLPLETFDHCIFVAPVWMGKIASPLLTFLSEERSHIKRYSFITICGGLAGQKEKIESQLVSILNSPPVKVSDLWISAIVDKGVPKDAKNISAYRVTPEELEKFKTEIEEFCYSILHENVLRAGSMVASNL
jgi:flavodoxin